jgi:hypothetical protein
MATLALTDEERTLLIGVVANAEARDRRAAEDETDGNRVLHASRVNTLERIRHNLIEQIAVAADSPHSNCSAHTGGGLA